MRVNLRLVAMSMCCALVVGVAGNANGMLLADLQADFDAHAHVDAAPGTGIADTDGTGSWEYAASSETDFSGGAPTLTPMTYAVAANSIIPGNNYIGTVGVLNLPAVSSDRVFDVQPFAAADELGIHPGSEFENQDELWITWTSGFSGAVNVTGWVHNISEDGNTVASYDGVDLSVFSDSGSLLDSYLAPSWGFTTMDASTNKVPFDSDLSGLAVNVGDKLYFRVSALSSFAGDNTGIQIQISEVPEPSSIALLVGCLVGFAGMARRRRAS